IKSMGLRSFFYFFLIFLIFSGNLCDVYGQAIKEPVFAGLFYPGEKNELERQILYYLNNAEKKRVRIKQHIFGLISPHAGYEYSGSVAAYGFSQVKGRAYKTVIIIGTSHRVPFRGISIYPGGQWKTPLGTIPVDGEFSKALMKECPQLKTYPLPFANEHSIEVQLPFLQMVLKDFKIVPLITGGMDKKDYVEYVDALMRLVKKNPRDILIVASTDMSHYHDYNTAKTIDALTLRHMEDMDAEGLIRDLDGGKCELCGPHGAIMLIMMGKRLNGAVKLLQYANSGDVTGNKSHVVGYSALAFFYKDDKKAINYDEIKKETSKAELTRNEKRLLLEIARKTLEEYVTEEKIPDFDIKDKRLLEKRGVFVTLKKNGALRGCIGYIDAVLPLYRAVVDMTVAASSRDMRFLPVHKGELKDIKIEISVLSPLRRINNIEEIEVGKHGLFLKRGNYSGLLLPQVAVEYGWDREEFLKQTCIKAGLYRDAWKEKQTEIYIFSCQIFSE
ncbi:MAG TPA: AmmeMemoRadiSam system protein B, partial [Syntrophorhabdaceae bacterium]|nr:AmmeMemoRadiSam system protein B [Syntrophorhabdaceae bacterium]